MAKSQEIQTPNQPSFLQSFITDEQKLLYWMISQAMKKKDSGDPQCTFWINSDGIVDRAVNELIY